MANKKVFRGHLRSNLRSNADLGGILDFYTSSYNLSVIQVTNEGLTSNQRVVLALCTVTLG